MFRVLILGNENKQLIDLAAALGEKEFDCTIAHDGEESAWEVGAPPIDLMLVPMDGAQFGSPASRLANMIRQERGIPVIALLSRGMLGRLDSSLGIDDFAVEPWDATEIAVRANRVLRKLDSRNHEELIECGNLTIDQSKCEVSLGSKLVSLSFREYELLRFLASNRGKVFTRDALLNKVWGYDYYGGDRTVDVHIRRIRSKIEEKDSSFIETVRNIGYKFKEDT